MKGVTMVLVVVLAFGAPTPGQAALLLPDGTVTANRQDSGTGSGSWFGESVTTLTIDAQNLAAGAYVQVSGKITGISDLDNSWAEIGLIPKERWDYWQIAFGGLYKSAVFDKGLYVVHWQETGKLGLGLKEGWNVAGSTVHGTPHPYAWDLSAPSTSDPWEFAFTMYPKTVSGDPGGDAYLAVTGETVSGPLPYEYGLGTSDNNDFSECYLIAQLWSMTEDATFSFEDVKAEVIPEPSTFIIWSLLGALAVTIGWWRRRRAA